jgi:hypothetical protein
MMEVVPAENREPELKLFVIDGVLQLSVAVGAVHVAVMVVEVELGRVKLIFAGQATKVGANTSLAHGSMVPCTVTVKEQTDVLLAASLAV